MYIPIQSQMRLDQSSICVSDFSIPFTLLRRFNGTFPFFLKTLASILRGIHRSRSVHWPLGRTSIYCLPCNGFMLSLWNCSKPDICLSINYLSTSFLANFNPMIYLSSVVVNLGYMRANPRVPGGCKAAYVIQPRIVRLYERLEKMLERELEQ